MKNYFKKKRKKKELKFIGLNNGNLQVLCSNRFCVPVIIKEVANITIIFCHWKSIATSCRAYWSNWLNIKTAHTHHFGCCFPAKREWMISYRISQLEKKLDYQKNYYLSIGWSLIMSWQNLQVNSLPQQAARSLQFLL